MCCYTVILQFPPFCFLDGLVLIQGQFPVWLLMLLLGLFLSAIVFCTTTNDQPPKYHPVSTCGDEHGTDKCRTFWAVESVPPAALISHYQHLSHWNGMQRLTGCFVHFGSKWMARPLIPYISPCIYIITHPLLCVNWSWIISETRLQSRCVFFLLMGMCVCSESDVCPVSLSSLLFWASWSVQCWSVQRRLKWSVSCTCSVWCSVSATLCWAWLCWPGATA